MSRFMKLIDDFTTYYRNFSQHSLDELAGFYDPVIVFADPIHQITGLDNVERYFAAMCDNLSDCRFEFIGETIDDKSAWFKWVMYYQHPRLKNGAPLQLTGASYIQFSETDHGFRITHHEDFYDVGAMLYEHVPVLGTGIRWIKRQLSETKG